MTMAWQGLIDFSCSVGFLLGFLLLLSIFARWMTGSLTHRFLFRFLIGFAMMIYVLYVPGPILTALDPARAQGILFAIDRSGGILMIIGYLTLAGITAFLTSAIIGPFIVALFAIFLLALFPGAVDFINSYGEEIILIGILYALGSQAWAMVPSED